MFYRNECVICNHSLIQITQQDQHVLSYSPTVMPSSCADKTSFPIGYCFYCNSIQYMKLVEPSILYKDSHNETYHTPTWSQHHSIFYHFFKDFLCTVTSCIEIGGAQCILFDRVKNEYPLLNYHILDIIEQPLTSHTIKIGNCEDYLFTEECAILSHVFEHLHNPKTFLKNIQRSSIQYVILSIPNLEYLLEHDNLNLIHIEHTFYYNRSHIEYLFNEISFSCIKYEPFQYHSSFFIFKRTEIPITPPTFICNDKLIEYYLNRERKLNTISLTIDNDIWIAPAGHYGYTIYLYLVKNGYSNQIKAFIDNDLSKHNKYLNGTDVKIIPYSELVDKNNLTIILYAGNYNKEITSQIHQLNKNVTIITI